MAQFEIVIRNAHPTHSGLDEYYSQTFEADTQQEAEVKALRSFRECLPFTIQGERIEVYAVNGVRNEKLTKA